MSATNAFETGILSLIFENANFANIGDATGLRGSSTAGVFYISLHTADPTDAGDQTSSEATYTDYARVSVARSTSGWTVSGNAATNDAAITFPACTGGSSVCTHIGIGSDASGTGNLWFKGTLTPSLSISNGITPEIAIGQATITGD